MPSVSDTFLEDLIKATRGECPPPSLVPKAHLITLMALAANIPEKGAAVEVGVYCGGSAWHLWGLYRDKRELWLCDTFTGIPYSDPEKGDKHKVGDFECPRKAVERMLGPHPDLHYVEGIFPQSMPADFPTEIAFAHLDTDQYQSTRDAAIAITPRMVTGGIMVFDDYYALESVRRAVDDITEGGQGLMRPQPFVVFK